MSAKERSTTAMPESGEEKSLGSHAAERHLMVAVGFSRLKPTATITLSLRDGIKMQASPATAFPDVLSR